MKKTIFLMLIGVFIAGFANASCEQYVPPTNGCSDPLYRDQIDPSLNFSDACNSHDVCYQVIGPGKAACDDNFGTNLADSCARQYSQQVCTVPDPLNPFSCSQWSTVFLPGYDQCLVNAAAFKEAVVLMGEPYFRTGQDNATNWARSLANNLTCGISPSSSGVFLGNNNMITLALYQNILGRAPSSAEYAEAQRMFPTDGWQYELIRQLDKKKAIQTAVGIAIRSLQD